MKTSESIDKISVEALVMPPKIAQGIINNPGHQQGR